MGIKERITEFIQYKGITRSAFERACGLSNAYTRNLKDTPSSEKLEDILKAFPELSRVWLLTGEGKMVTESINASVNQEVNGDGNNFSAAGDVEVGCGVPSSLLQHALDEISEMRSLLSESMKNTNNISQRLLALLEKE